MYKYIFIFILFTNSCSFIKHDINNIYNKCGTFNINIKNFNNKDSLFYLKLKTALDDKFILLHHNKNNNVCSINILDIIVNNYVPLVDNSGIASRNNKKIEVNYFIDISNKLIKSKVIIFYDSNISENYYSNYIYNNKIIDNNIEILSEKIFHSVIENINKHGQ